MSFFWLMILELKQRESLATGERSLTHLFLTTATMAVYWLPFEFLSDLFHNVK